MSSSTSGIKRYGTLPLRLWTDSTAAIGVTSRQGVGKIRHLDTRTLWVQQAVRTGRLEVRKVKGTENPADLSTKHLPSAEKLKQLVELFGCRFEDGRAACAPTMRRDRLTQKTLGSENTSAHQVNSVEKELFCDIKCLPHNAKNVDEEHEKLVSVEDEYPDADEKLDPVEKVGLEIAKSIQDQSDRFGRKRRYDDEEPNKK